MRLRRLASSPRVRLLLLGVLLAGATAAGLVLAGGSRGGISDAIDSAGPLGPVAFVVLYVVLTVLFFPGAVLTAAGGAAFGAALGTVLAVIGATIGASGAFLIGRRAGREQVEQIAGGRIGTIDRWLARRGFLAVLYVRLIPVIPFNALNYAAGVTAVRTRDYVLGTALGVVPGAFAYAALGSSLGDPTSPEFIAALALVILLAVGAPLVQRALRGRGTPPTAAD
jgi:uncharacterized membrane protein YdjX (TVP38/TMEM64 family)